VLIAGELQKVRRAVVLGFSSEITKGEAKRRFEEMLRPVNNEGVHPLEPFTWRSFPRAGATVLHVNNVPLKVQPEIMGHAAPEMSLLYTEADLSYR
jgi:hypothetical protein